MKHSWLPPLWIESAIIIAICAVMIFVFNHHNHNNDMVRYFHGECPNIQYYLLMLSYSVFVIAIGFNLRYFFSFYANRILFLK